MVTGQGVVTPLGTGVDKFWAAMQRSDCGIREVQSFDTEDLYITIAGEVPAALLMAAGDLGLGALAVILARGVGTGPDMETALETRQAALTELEDDFAALEAEIRRVRDELASMKTAATSFLHRPLGSPLLAMILPLVKALTKSHHREKE